MMRRLQRRRCSAARRGMSVLEFLGCLSAMVGGVVLGSMYLGVNIKDMAYTVLEQAQVVEPRPGRGQARRVEDAAPAADATTLPVVAGPVVSPPRQGAEPPAPPQPDEPSPPPPDEVGPTTPAAPPPPPAGLFARADLITDEQRKALTMAYWESLAACMSDEVHRRVPAIDEDGNWQLFDYLTGRKDGHLAAAAAIAALDARGVDDHVMAYAKRAHAWHENGAKLFGRAVDLLTDAPTAQLKGPFAQSWQSAATQHRMESRLLAEKSQAVQTYLTHTYGNDGAATAPAAP